MKSHTTKVDGIKMRWEEQGDGPAIIFVHGIPTSPALWRDVIPQVSGARCIAWEMVGYGESIPEGPGRDLSVKRQAQYLRRFMEALGIERAILVGHDLGGGVVQIAAVRDPSICLGLVLVDAVGYDSWPIPSVKLMRAAPQVMARLPKPVLKRALRLLIRRGHDDRGIAKVSLNKHFAPYAAHDGAKALVRQMQALHTSDTQDVANHIGRLRDRPARVVWGAADPFQKLRYGRRFARDLDCELVTISGGKHFVPEDHPDVVARAVQDVLRDCIFQAVTVPIRH